MDERREAAVVIGADRDSLLGVRATADQPVDALARERDPHGTPSELRRGSPEQMVGPQRLAAEPAADVGRGEMNLTLVDSEHLRERPGVQLHPLAGVVDDEVVAVPRERHRVGLDRVVVVARRAVREVDGVGRVARVRPPRRRRAPRPAGRRGCQASAGAPWPPRRFAASRTRRRPRSARRRGRPAPVSRPGRPRPARRSSGCCRPA